jgi:ADP-ribose pyrophosphatase YjhB (NUDIX family)
MITIRVYGIYINEKKQVLVSDELIKGKLYTKFPGGGLEFGEGTRDCLIREFREEMAADIIVKEHLYTTDFYLESAFATGVQVISIYYEVDFIQPLLLEVNNQSPTMEDFLQNNPQAVEKHRLIEMGNFEASIFQLPIDKLTVKIIKEKYL